MINFTPYLDTPLPCPPLTATLSAPAVDAAPGRTNVDYQTKGPPAPDIVIRAENLGKKYTIGHQVGNGRYVALRDVLGQNACEHRQNRRRASGAVERGTSGQSG